MSVLKAILILIAVAMLIAYIAVTTKAINHLEKEIT